MVRIGRWSRKRCQQEFHHPPFRSCSRPFDDLESHVIPANWSSLNIVPLQEPQIRVSTVAAPLATAITPLPDHDFADRHKTYSNRPSILLIVITPAHHAVRLSTQYGCSGLPTHFLRSTSRPTSLSIRRRHAYIRSRRAGNS